jgi:hypothetical protein
MPFIPNDVQISAPAHGLRTTVVLNGVPLRHVTGVEVKTGKAEATTVTITMLAQVNYTQPAEPSAPHKPTEDEWRDLGRPEGQP